MTTHRSFVKCEDDFRALLKEKVNSAESTEDVKKFFDQAVHRFLKTVFGEESGVRYEDVRFDPDHKNCYVISEHLRNMSDFRALWQNSDFRHDFSGTQAPSSCM